MAAKVMHIFIFRNFQIEPILRDIAVQLGLVIDVLPPDFPSQFSAQKNSGREYLLLDYSEDRNDMIEELINWEYIYSNQKDILLNCHSCLDIHYRRKEVAIEALTVIGQALSTVRSKCIVENGFGCLIPLDTFLNCLQDTNWTWEKKAFPELPGVAQSEWLE